MAGLGHRAAEDHRSTDRSHGTRRQRSGRLPCGDPLDAGLRVLRQTDHYRLGPGIEGITTWKASAALAPCAVGSVSGSMIFSCSMTEPGHPWLMMSGKASSCFERTWMKWMSSPSISVMNCGSAFSLASHLRQSYLVPQ